MKLTDCFEISLSPTRSPARARGRGFRVQSALGALLLLLPASQTLIATTIVNWNGWYGSYPVGTEVTPTGKAAAVAPGAWGGTGVDLVILLDLRTGMGRTTDYTRGRSLLDWAKQAARTLVQALPSHSSSVEILTFENQGSGSGGSLVPQVVVPLTPLSEDRSEILSAIDALTESTAGGGLHYTAPVINRAFTDARGERHVLSHAPQVALIADGFGIAGANHWDNFDQRYVVGLPGYAPRDTKHLVAGDDSQYGTADDNGIFAEATDMSSIVQALLETSATPVGVERVEVTLPDGSVVEVSLDPFGNFAPPEPWPIVLGPQEWIATAWGEDGSAATDQCPGYGFVPQPEPVPDGGATALLLASVLSLAALGRGPGRSGRS